MPAEVSGGGFFEDLGVLHEFGENLFAVAAELLGVGVDGVEEGADGGEAVLWGVPLRGWEAAYEGGRSLSNSFTLQDTSIPAPIPQVHDEIEAWAADARVDYLLADQHHTRLSAEVILASGDDDRTNTTNTFGGNRAGTKDNAFNAFGLLNTGLAFAPNVSNMLALRIGGSSFPLDFNACTQRL